MNPRAHQKNDALKYTQQIHKCSQKWRANQFQKTFSRGGASKDNFGGPTCLQTLKMGAQQSQSASNDRKINKNWYQRGPRSRKTTPKFKTFRGLSWRTVLTKMGIDFEAHYKKGIFQGRFSPPTATSPRNPIPHPNPRLEASCATLGPQRLAHRASDALLTEPSSAGLKAAPWWKQLTMNDGMDKAVVNALRCGTTRMDSIAAIRPCMKPILETCGTILKVELAASLFWVGK